MTTEQIKEDVQNTLFVLRSMADAIRDLGEVPSGHLYTAMMQHVDFQLYQRLLSVLKDSGLVEEKNFLLTWKGPKL